MGLKAQNIIKFQRWCTLCPVLGTPQAFPANITLNLDPPMSVAVSRSARLFYTFIHPSSVASCRWAS